MSGAKRMAHAVSMKFMFPFIDSDTIGDLVNLVVVDSVKMNTTIASSVRTITVFSL